MGLNVLELPALLVCGLVFQNLCNLAVVVLRCASLTMHIIRIVNPIQILKGHWICEILWIFSSLLTWQCAATGFLERYPDWEPVFSEVPKRFANSSEHKMLCYIWSFKIITSFMGLLGSWTWKAIQNLLYQSWSPSLHYDSDFIADVFWTGCAATIHSTLRDSLDVVCVIWCHSIWKWSARLSSHSEGITALRRVSKQSTGINNDIFQPNVFSWT